MWQFLCFIISSVFVSVSRIQAASCRVCRCSSLRGLYPIWFDAKYYVCFPAKRGFSSALSINFGIYSMFNCHAQHITNFYINLMLGYQKCYQFSCMCECVYVWMCDGCDYSVVAIGLSTFFKNLLAFLSVSNSAQIV